MKDSLDNWRKEIDKIDDEIIHLLAQRTEIVKKIGEYKVKNQIPPLDQKRWSTLLKYLMQKGETLNLPQSLIKNIYTTIHEHSVSVQEQLKK